jgi:hypothetical protein
MAHGFLLAGFAGQFVAIARYVYMIICSDSSCHLLAHLIDLYRFVRDFAQAMFVYIPILLQQLFFPFNWPPALVSKPAHGPQGSPLLRGASLMMQTVQTIQRPL